MTFVVKISGDTERPMVAEYTCPEHGLFDAEVKRDENGDAPDEQPCPHELVECDWPGDPPALCGQPSPWSPPLLSGRAVRKVTAIRGGWQKPERKAWLDTRELGEGMPIDEWREKRRKIREEQRHKEVKELLR